MLGSPANVAATLGAIELRPEVLLTDRGSLHRGVEACGQRMVTADDELRLSLVSAMANGTSATTSSAALAGV